MKQKIIIFVLFIVTIIGYNFSEAKATMLLEGNVTKNEQVPTEFYGTWVVAAQQVANPDESLYNSSSVDIWTLTKENNIITLRNPLSGAVAAIKIEEVKGNTVRFSRVSKNYEEIGYEVPTITISGDFFDGSDELIIKKYKNNKLIREDVLKYKLKGKRVASEDIFR